MRLSRRHYVTRNYLYPSAFGINAPLITIEIHISNGLPGLTMVGLPETTVKEARDRVRSAIINSGYTFPAKKLRLIWLQPIFPKREDGMIYPSLLRFWWHQNNSRQPG